VAFARPRFDIGDILRRRLADLGRHPLSLVQRKVASCISRCRTSALGGHVDVCLDCGHEQPSYNSCGNRNCPKCQAAKQEEWIEARAKRLLPIGHFHLVFTLPSELRDLALRYPALVYAALFQAASYTLLKLGRQHLKATLGVTLVLHTWTRDLRLHPHVHGLVSAGGLALDGSEFVPTVQDFLFHVYRMGEIFRGKMLEILRKHQEQEQLGLGEVAFNVLMASLAKHKRWVVYAKEPFKEPWHVLAYLARYTHRVGIANSRILEDTGEEVTFRTRGKGTTTLPVMVFLLRFLLHVLPQGFTKIRHYGLYGSVKAGGLLEKAHACLGGKAIPEFWRGPILIDPPDAPEGAKEHVCSECGGALRRTILPRPKGGEEVVPAARAPPPGPRP